MASVNKVFLLGNLTRDPELRYTPSGAGVASFGLAVNRRYKVGNENKEEVCFVDITVWGKQGENCVEYLSKGSQVMIEGRLQFRSWETDDGQKRNKLDVVANNVQFLGKPGGGAGRSMDSFEEEDGMGVKDDIPF
ncbi:Single-stranded DNA-binding protein [Nitrospina gracilis 3/211]|uniref:Single-stranded DNA-binding protein n=1 Tax=Nitrospina gracilis (strain 3/211) TaxID=1266370 RepID=M1Z0R7_NITG3|nr:MULTISPECIES: single-stranded DNA-binding protein [Nitrospina]MCF8724170.1 single-strand DNA-binding protein [Nitrospina sp. Nb-3]CCQ91316.1 Single-stranded DNA-binding protein [Nitrospina gracilis 3/211]